MLCVSRELSDFFSPSFEKNLAVYSGSAHNRHLLLLPSASGISNWLSFHLQLSLSKESRGGGKPLKKITSVCLSAKADGKRIDASVKNKKCLQLPFPRPLSSTSTLCVGGYGKHGVCTYSPQIVCYINNAAYSNSVSPFLIVLYWNFNSVITVHTFQALLKRQKASRLRAREEKKRHLTSQDVRGFSVAIQLHSIYFQTPLLHSPYTLPCLD